jgi:predicted RNase H-like nuclease
VSPGRRRRGPELPYELLAGVVPCRGGWLVAGGKLVGTGLFPETAFVEKRLVEIVDHIPQYSIICLAAPIGLPDEPAARGRECDREARHVLGWPRLGAILSAPALPVAQRATTYDDAARLNGGKLSPVTWGQMKRIREVREVVQSHVQRNVYEVHPELSFYQLNGDAALRHGKHTPEGQKEREELLVRRFQGLANRLDDERPRGATQANLLDACAALWTARRVAAKASARLPKSPEWNADGLRMELVR